MHCRFIYVFVRFAGFGCWKFGHNGWWGFVCLTFKLRRCIWSLTWSFTTRRSCWIATRKNFSRKSCCRAFFDLLGRIKKSCVIASTANLTTFLRWARLFFVFVVQAFVHKLFRLKRLYQIPGEHNQYSGHVAMLLCFRLHFSQNHFVLKVLFETFYEVDDGFCWGQKLQCFLLFSGDALLIDTESLLLFCLVCRLYEVTNFEAWKLMVLWLLSRITLT